MVEKLLDMCVRPSVLLLAYIGAHIHTQRFNSSLNLFTVLSKPSRKMLASSLRVGLCLFYFFYFFSICVSFKNENEVNKMGGGMKLSLLNLGRLRKESNKKKKQNNHQKKLINM